jgi:hypothetical protein
VFVNTPPGIDDLSASTSKNGAPSGTGALGLGCLNEPAELLSHCVPA